MDEEPILLHEPNLMRAILRAAQHGPAGRAEALAELMATLRTAREPIPPDGGELEERLDEALRLLVGAAALAPEAAGRYRLTERGAELLARHPDGIDQTVLAADPEFRRFLARQHLAARGAGADEQQLDAYFAGMAAFAEGAPADANPYPADVSAHLAWENGWCEARDGRAQGT